MNRQLLSKILNDVKVDLTDEFDRNFARKGFFNKAWQPRKFPSKGSLLMQTGALRKSVRARISGDTVIFSSDTPYAAIHNYGGKVQITAKMKKFFWAMYLKTKADHWKGLALKKEGSFITIPQRQFIGWHQSLQKNVDQIVSRRVSQYVDDLAKQFNKNHKS